MKTIRLLQLSDIHWKKQLDAADDYTDIRDQMLQDLEYYCQGTGNAFDKILICGDIAFSGSVGINELIHLSETCVKPLLVKAKKFIPFLATMTRM